MLPTSFQFFKLKEVEWKVIKAIPRSLTITEVARRAGIPQYRVSRVLSRLKEKTKISFEVDFRRLGITPMAVLTSTSPSPNIPFLRAVRVVRFLGRKSYLVSGLVPEEFIDNWLAYFKSDRYVIRALERAWWDPEKAVATAYVNGWIVGNLEVLRGVENLIVSQGTRLTPKDRVPLDEADLAILMVKMSWAFNSLRKAEKDKNILKYIGRRISHQALSRHYRKHILRVWRGNRVRLYRSLVEVPYMLMYLEGRSAGLIARLLVQLPWFHTAYIDLGRALVSGQPPCSSLLPLMQLFDEYEVYMPLGEILMEPSLQKYVPDTLILRDIVKMKVRER